MYKSDDQIFPHARTICGSRLSIQIRPNGRLCCIYSHALGKLADNGPHYSFGSIYLFLVVLARKYLSVASLYFCISQLLPFFLPFVSKFPPSNIFISSPLSFLQIFLFSSTFISLPSYLYFLNPILYVLRSSLRSFFLFLSFSYNQVNLSASNKTRLFQAVTNAISDVPTITNFPFRKSPFHPDLKCQWQGWPCFASVVRSHKHPIHLPSADAT